MLWPLKETGIYKNKILQIFCLESCTRWDIKGRLMCPPAADGYVDRQKRAYMYNIE